MTTTSQEEFAFNHDLEQDTIPERLLDDGLIQYFRSRYSVREKLMSTFDRHEAERVKSELARIDRLRDHFRFGESHKSDMDELRSSLAKWKQAARIETTESIQKLNFEINQLHREIEIKQRVNGDGWALAEDMKKLASKSKRYKSLESLLAKLIPTPNQEPEEPLQHPHFESTIPRTNSQLDSDSMFTVSAVTLEKGSLRGSYTMFSIEKFAIDSVLHGGNNGDRDPLREQRNPNSLRYFHFPANNMIWVS